MNGLLTCELLSRKPGDAVPGLALTPKGKILSDVVVLVRADHLLVVVQRATVEELVASFEHHLMMEDADLSRTAHDVWFVHGPASVDALRAAESGGAAGGAFDVTGSGGAVIVTSAGDRAEAELVRAAIAAGGGLGDECGWDAVRHLAKVVRFGVDFDDSTYPQEAALETRSVSFGKGCYLGQEVVCMLEMRGHVKRRLVSLSLEGGEVPASHAAVLDAEGANVGEVTSAARVAEGEVRALAMVKQALGAKGTMLSVGGRPAQVT
jgi:folate-binding protein YgfZ